MKIIKYIIPILVLPILISCGGEDTNMNKEIENEEISNTIVITPPQFELGKMELGTFSNQTFHKIVKANGMLDVPPENKSTVSAYFGGYVKNISLLQGQKIAKGQTLFTLESPDYIQVQQDFLESKSQLSYLKSDYERQKELSSSNVSSQKTFLKAESDYKTTLARYESLKMKLQLMNINSNSVTELNLSSTIAVKAPISGFVTSVLATKGMFLNPSDIALTIMNTDHMHIELNIFEQDLTSVAIGQEVSFSFENGRTPYEAVVHLINKAIDPENRTVKVHCHFKNESDALSLTPGMFVEAEIYASTDSSLALPINAVVTIENKSYVLLQKESAKDQLEFEKVEVKVGQTNQDYIEILNAGDFGKKAQVLTYGAFNLIQE
jgi:cobalt-zinc-cadmium efflux system membrane fusion protein